MRLSNSVASAGLAIALALGLAGCASDEIVSAEQIALQNKVDGLITQELFSRNLDQHASYNIYPDGTVAIKFDESVQFQTYVSLVEWLRARPEIKAVRATQMGVEVCQLHR